MVKRIITGIVLIAAVVGLFFLRTIDVRFFDVLPFVCAAVGTFELVRSFGARVGAVQKTVSVIFAAAFVPIYVFLSLEAAMVFAFAAVVIHFFLLVLEFDNITLESVGLSVLAVFYPTLMLLPILLINHLSVLSLTALLLAFVVSPLADTVAYFVGTWVGGPKLCPKISPKKTVSGAVGGMIGGTVGSILVWAIFAKGTITDSAVLECILFLFVGIVCSALTELGDLVEGAMKRKLEIKDMGNIMPGHGGVLDRIDGIMFSSAFIYVLFMLFR